MPTQQALLSHAQLSNDGTPHAGCDTDAPNGGESAGCGLSALRLVPVPDTGPPFDGDLSAGAIATAAAWPFGWGVANVDQDTEAAGAGPGIGTADHGTRMTGPGLATASPGAGMADAGMADAGAANGGAGAAGSRAEDDWSRQFALLLTEALAGARPLRQILPWTTDRARSHLDKLIPLFSGGQRPRVRRVVTSRPTRDAIEMTVVVGVGTRTRALAVRLERAWQPQQTTRPAGAARSQLPGLTGQAARLGRTGRTAPQWLCTAIEAA
jgi:Family of unknown function (DUF6459)